MTWVFVGRQAEMSSLGEAWERACHNALRIALITGDGGTGKSTLTGRFVAGLPDYAFVRLVGDEAETALPYAALDQLIDRLRNLGAMGGSGLSTIERLPEPPERDALNEGALLLQCLVELCRSAPLIVVVDDVNLVDSPSLAALRFALRRFKGGGLLVLMTARTESLPSLPRGLATLLETLGARIDLAGLTRQDIRSLAEQSRFGRLSDRAAERLRAHTNGNPLHLRSLMSDLTVLQAERLDTPLPSPRSLSTLVLATLSQVSQDAQQLAAAASVLGSHARLRDAAELAGLADPLAAVEELQWAQLADLVDADSGTRIIFVHALFRTAVYDDLKAGRRAELHAGAGELTWGDESLKHHVRAAGAGPSLELVPALRALADQHRRAGAYTAAAEALLDAYRLSEPGPDQDILLLNAVDALVFDGDLSRASCYAEMVEDLPEDAYRVQVQARMSWLAGRHDRADALGRRAWALGQQLDPKARDDTAAMLAQMRIMRGDSSGALEWATRALTSGSLPPSLAEATVCCAAIAAALLGRFDEGFAWLGTQAWTADQKGYQPLRQTRGILRLWVDDVAGATQDLRAAPSPTGLGTVTGGGPYQLVFKFYLAEAEYRCGNWASAQDLAEQGVNLIEDLQQGWLGAFGHAVAALVPAAQGRWEVASAHLDSARRTARQLGDQPSRAYADNAAVHLAWCQSDAAAVVAAAEWLLANPGTHHLPGFFGWPLQHASALVHLGRVDEVAARLTEIESLATTHGRQSVLSKVARLRAEMAAARRETAAARALFGQAEQLGNGVSDALEVALLQASYGSFLRRRGERRAALERLADARHRFRALGAQPFLRRVDEELASGGRSAPASPATLPGLTAQETLVARLVSAGRTNREVAEELVVSVKTVSYHLGNVYAKVGVRSRTELAVRLMNQGPTD